MAGFHGLLVLGFVVGTLASDTHDVHHLDDAHDTHVNEVLQRQQKRLEALEQKLQQERARGDRERDRRIALQDMVNRGSLEKGPALGSSWGFGQGIIT